LFLARRFSRRTPITDTYATRYPGKCSTTTSFVLATGCGDPQTSGYGLVVANAQLAMNDAAKYPEFFGKGNGIRRKNSPPG